MKLVQNPAKLKASVEYLYLNKGEIDKLLDGNESRLHYAAKYGSKQSVEVLLDAGASIDVQDYLGMTALTIAISEGNTDIALFLLDRGADPAIEEISTICSNMSTEYDTALHYAVRHGNVAVAEAIYAKNPELLETKGHAGFTPSQLACGTRAIEVIEALNASADHPSDDTVLETGAVLPLDPAIE